MRPHDRKVENTPQDIAMAKKSRKDECAIPTKPSIDAIKQVAIEKPNHRHKEISEYVEWQCNKGRGRKKKIKVRHLEKIKAEVVFGREHIVWDVHTDEPSRWWVITAPTNLYSQELFPSLDYTLSFHVGVMARVGSRDAKNAPEGSKSRLRSTWRRWENATDAIDTATEPEDFQAIGVMCREALIELCKGLQNEVIVPPDVERPKSSDVTNWSALIAAHYAGGARNAHIRSYLRTATKETWQLASWLTHSASASLHEAHMVLDATFNAISMITTAVMNFEAGAPESCPICKSYRIVPVFEPDMNLDPPYINVCEACDWNSYDGAQEGSEKRGNE